MGRRHFYWSDRNGRFWEFHKDGASGKSYVQNLLYMGEIKQTLGVKLTATLVRSI